MPDPVLFNIYCDESCHLENDRIEVMSFGAVWCPKAESSSLAKEIRQKKRKHNANGELKWQKVSWAKFDFYSSIIEWFFSKAEINFRGLLVRNKSSLDHASFNQGSHDTFYYKMYFSLLREILNPVNKYNVYLDVKDTRSANKIRELKDVLCNNFHDFTREMINRIQSMQSYEFELLQLADFFLGAFTYKNRGLTKNRGKAEVVRLIESHLKYPMKYSTSREETKFNLFLFDLK